MDDPAFPDSHYTSTTTTTGTVQQQTVQIDMAYLKSVPGILRIVEILLLFVYWITCAVCNYSLGYPISIGVVCWMMTIAFFVLFLLQLDKRLDIINWLLTEMLHNAIWTMLIFTSACVVASRAAWLNNQYYLGHPRGCLPFASVVGFAVMILYAVSTLLNLRVFEAGGGLRRLTHGSGGGGGTQTVTSTATVTTTDYPQKTEEAPPPYSNVP